MSQSIPLDCGDSETMSSKSHLMPRRSILQFSLRSVFLFTAIAAAYFSGVKTSHIWDSWLSGKQDLQVPMQNPSGIRVVYVKTRDALIPGDYVDVLSAGLKTTILEDVLVYAVTTPVNPNAPVVFSVALQVDERGERRLRLAKEKTGLTLKKRSSRR